MEVGVETFEELLTNVVRPVTLPVECTILSSVGGLLLFLTKE